MRLCAFKRKAQLSGPFEPGAGDAIALIFSGGRGFPYFPIALQDTVVSYLAGKSCLMRDPGDEMTDVKYVERGEDRGTVVSATGPRTRTQGTPRTHPA